MPFHKLMLATNCSFCKDWELIKIASRDKALVQNEKSGILLLLILTHPRNNFLQQCNSEQFDFMQALIAHSESTQRTLRAHSEHIRRTLREHSENTHSTQKTLQRTLRENSPHMRSIPLSAARHFWRGQTLHLNKFFLI